ncbi:protein VCF1-like [Mobula hypostoma]|uniref:protein VCF1-like n=1 Tax=Mobula hypostoma TaxID=723540 RepID=UPI002FC2E534
MSFAVAEAASRGRALQGQQAGGGGNTGSSHGSRCQNAFPNVSKNSSKKRRRSCKDEESQPVPPPKRLSNNNLLQDLPRDSWDCESSSSDSSSIVSSPDRLNGHLPAEANLNWTKPGNSSTMLQFSDSIEQSAQGPYLQINQILKEAHFYSLHQRGHQT